MDVLPPPPPQNVTPYSGSHTRSKRIEKATKSENNKRRNKRQTIGKHDNVKSPESKIDIEHLIKRINKFDINRLSGGKKTRRKSTKSRKPRKSTKSRKLRKLTSTRKRRR